MKSGYEIKWTDHALNELDNTIDYLKNNWTETEISELVLNLEEKLKLIAENPYLYQKSSLKKDIHRVVILTYNTMYYKIKNNQVVIVSFFSNRQNESRLKLK